MRKLMVMFIATVATASILSATVSGARAMDSGSKDPAKYKSGKSKSHATGGAGSGKIKYKGVGTGMTK
jgi:hypothetical protein